MFGYETPVAVFTVGACAAWGFALWWAFKRPKYRWYHVWLLFLSTLFWWLGESIAIRLGKYEYARFPFLLHLPGAGSPGNPGPLENRLLSLLPQGESLPSALDPSCVAKTWDIPFPVVAIEAALLFGLFRLSVCLFTSDKGGRLRSALATAGLSALLLVNVTAVLDPVVSTTKWCEKAFADPNYHFLNFGLWEWFTTQTHQGYWFGVPLINYAAWFIAAASFGFVARWDDQRQDRAIRKSKILTLYFLATIVMTVAVFAVLILAKLVVDRVLVQGQDYLFGAHPIVGNKAWQFGVIAGLLGLGLLASYRGRRHHDPQFESVSSVPKVVVFVFCLGLLLIQPHIGIFAVWFVTAVIATIVLLWPFIASVVNRRRAPIPPGVSTSGDAVSGGG